MNIATAHLKSVSPYSMSRYHATPKKDDKERPDEWEKRTWLEKTHATEAGNVFIPAMAFKQALDAAAKFRSEKLSGTKTYAKRFQSGILIQDSIVLPNLKKELPGEWIFAHADGRRGSGKRVLRCFPYVAAWEGRLTVYVLDAAITKDVLFKHLVDAGRFIGIGRFRAENGGYLGRFSVADLDWSEARDG